MSMEVARITHRGRGPCVAGVRGGPTPTPRAQGSTRLIPQIDPQRDLECPDHQVHPPPERAISSPPRTVLAQPVRSWSAPGPCLTNAHQRRGHYGGISRATEARNPGPPCVELRVELRRLEPLTPTLPAALGQDRRNSLPCETPYAIRGFASMRTSAYTCERPRIRANGYQDGYQDFGVQTCADLTWQ